MGQEIEGLDEGRPAPQRGEDGKFKAGDKDKGKGKEVTPPDDKPDDVPAGQPGKPPVKAAQLREAYDTLKQEKATWGAERQKLEARVKELEEAHPTEVKGLTDRATAAEKRRDELEAHMQFLDFKRSAKFQKEYEQPYIDAYTRAVADFGQLEVRVPSGEDPITHEPQFSHRKATADDLLYLANLDLSKMDEEAEEMFGRSAARVIRHVEKVRELSDAQNRALQEAQTKTGEWFKTQQVNGRKAAEERHKLWTEYNQAIAERFPKMFKPLEGDNDGNTLLKKGFAEADRIFVPTPETAFKTSEERIQAHARARNKIANHDRLVSQIRQLRKDLEERDKTIAGYEGSAPPVGGRASAKPPSKSFMDEANAEIDALNTP
jgi:chromosome segregation ATPase